jgi:hypothetical protein
VRGGFHRRATYTGVVAGVSSSSSTGSRPLPRHEEKQQIGGVVRRRHQLNVVLLLLLLLVGINQSHHLRLRALRNEIDFPVALTPIPPLSDLAPRVLGEETSLAGWL